MPLKSYKICSKIFEHRNDPPPFWTMFKKLRIWFRGAPLMEVFRYVKRYLNVLRAFSECSPSECALNVLWVTQGGLRVCSKLYWPYISGARIVTLTLGWVIISKVAFLPTDQSWRKEVLAEVEAWAKAFFSYNPFPWNVPLRHQPIKCNFYGDPKTLKNRSLHL